MLARVRIDAETRTVTVEWPDGSQRILPWSKLRAACPCALCRVEAQRAREDPMFLRPPPNDTLTDFAYVGNYAVRFFWGDGHSSGLYTWRYLRELDPDG
ncbi:DUF971 domain-containing protein [Thermoflexus sp.]|uniref:DUF971 domain-containing protein n=1 Tax=Thermoflexus sp. TaxID=1969742 RepID=UPI0025E35A09|nr:DUF971 domain-containing protein [Thermoflexus sp.]MDW8179965.1 DUF971 domain-containing protein [Anaerolineae bacterium]MCS6962526.1 DUF971 domain-containing protein [Thermoflexus sp.]MCS7350514.1 DUF971 domain-containing protein [Thermoflexus sp.]MCX7690313.1 DUF971 domain-containing protein [Thermoflexus sp.]MDW8183635.1 DUF971 domain-containing protein [Anaerolineae bacterium]